jgi:cytochrome c oxidase assembly protein subunit 15
MMTVLAIWIFLREKRRSIGWLAAAALAAVIVQGMLGGITVLFLLPPAVSVLHACLAQAFFCLTVALAVVTGRNWPGDRGAAPRRDLRGWAAAATLAIYLQLILGAVMRHTGAGLAIPDFPLALGRLVPPLGDAKVAIHFAHRLWALVVVLLIAAVVRRALRSPEGRPALFSPAILMALLAALQIALGAFTVLSGKAVVPTTAHVATGAALLGTSVVLTLRVWAPVRPAMEEARAA